MKPALNEIPLPKYIAIEGPIGVGKTTLANKIAETFNYDAFLEQPAENPFLKNFYRNPSQSALATQLFFLFQRMQQIQDLKSSNEAANTKQEALAAISNLGAINAEQTLSLLQGKLQRNAEGKVVVLNGGVEQDFNTYLGSLKNPGSGWEHHFKPSSAAGMGAKPSPVANAGGGQPNPWKTGNITQQMLLSEQDPQMAAVLKQEAQNT